MEYAAAKSDMPNVRSPELGRLKAAAERIARATNNVENFLVRFHGPAPEAASANGGPTTDSYRNDLEAVFVALERLEMGRLCQRPPQMSRVEHIGRATLYLGRLPGHSPDAAEGGRGCD
jgi:hypothetical protein